MYRFESYHFGCGFGTFSCVFLRRLVMVAGFAVEIRSFDREFEVVWFATLVTTIEISNALSCAGDGVQV